VHRQTVRKPEVAQDQAIRGDHPGLSQADFKPLRRDRKSRPRRERE
jgi:hypothetical protein